MNLMIPRRDFLKLGTAAALWQTLPTHSRAALSPNDKLRTAHIGVGGMGRSDLAAIASHRQVEVAAVCDVDQTKLDAALAKHPEAAAYHDYRELFAKLADRIDAVVISTPDHTHAPAAMTALNHGKPVYCQKPLTHEVFEARQLRLKAEQLGVPTQMGIQAHAMTAYRRARQMIQDGVIGRVSQVHAWSNKDWGYDGVALPQTAEPPETLHWNLWLGTAAERPFVPGRYHPMQWRKLIDFGTGTLGDMGVHIFDTPYAALQLTVPRWARTTCRAPTGIGHPQRNIVEYEFPGTAYTTDSLRWKWYDGSNWPRTFGDLGLASEFELPADVKLPGQASLFVGEAGLMLLPHISEARLYPEAKFQDYQRPEVKAGNHYHEWVEACLGRGKPSADFAYAGPLTEALLLGVVANRFPGEQLHWDAEALQVTNLPAANELLRRDYREEFGVEGL